jgi:hypothetical protein
VLHGLLEAQPLHPEFQAGLDFFREEYRCQFFYGHKVPPFICLIARRRANEQNESFVMSCTFLIVVLAFQG